MALTKVQKEGIETLINNNASTKFITGTNNANELDCEANLSYNNSLVTFSSSNLLIDKSTNPTLTAKETAGNKEVQLRANTTGGLLRTAGSYPLVLGTNQTERLRVDSLGNVGIGTTTPTSLLELASHRNAETDKFSASNYHLHLRNTENDNGEAIGISFAITSDETAVGAAILHERDAGGSQGSLQFLTNSNGSSVTERMRIDSSGNVGIGMTTVGAALDVNGASGDTLRLSNGSASAQYRIGRNSTDGKLEFFGTQSGDIAYTFGGVDGERMRIDSSGRMFLGLSSTSFPKKLNIQGSSGSIIALKNHDTTSYAADTNTSIEFGLNTGNTGNQNGACEIRAFKENGTNGNNARGLSFYTGANGGSNQERMRIDSSGNVSFGGSVDAFIKNNGPNIIQVHTNNTLCTEFSANQRVRMPQVFSTAGSSMRDVQCESDGTLACLTSITESKINIADVTDVSWLYNLKPKTFNFRKKTVDAVTGVNTYLDEAEDEKAYGLLAEDVETINKDFCFYDKDSEGNDVLKGVYYKTMVVPLLKAVQDLKAENTALTTRVAALEAAK